MLPLSELLTTEAAPSPFLDTVIDAMDGTAFAATCEARLESSSDADLSMTFC